MIDGDSITIRQHDDVIGFVSDQIGRGSALGAVYSRFPASDEAIDDLTLALARHVLQRELTHRDPNPRDRWLETAYSLIAAGLPPVPAGYATETTVSRLVRWVDHSCASVLIGVIRQLDPAGLRDVRRVAEWMNRASGLPTTVVHSADAMPQTKRPALHRSSLEEQFALCLERDDELRDLFEPNVMVLSVFQTSPRADFVWRGGRLIVEIDSYRYHSSPDRFTGDRQRDYETGASGYVTLRLTDQEVAGDINLAVQKVRRFVRLRKNQFHV